MFTTYWKTITSPPESTPLLPNLHPTFDEQNALWYVGGYVLRSVRRNISKSNHIKKLDFLDVLDSFEDDCAEVDESDAKKWIVAIDRGHLIRCTNDFHTLLYSIEINIKTSFSYGKKTLEEHLKLAVDEEILRIWKNLCGRDAAVDDDYKFLLLEVVKMYITIRGFRHTSREMEKYKIYKKKNLQKTKSLRTRLQ